MPTRSPNHEVFMAQGFSFDEKKCEYKKVFGTETLTVICLAGTTHIYCRSDPVKLGQQIKKMEEHRKQLREQFPKKEKQFRQWLKSLEGLP